MRVNDDNTVVEVLDEEVTVIDDSRVVVVLLFSAMSKVYVLCRS